MVGELGGAEHRIGLSGGLVPGPSSLVGRKSGTAVHWRSEWPMGDRSDGQPGASHTGSLYRGLSWTVSLFFSPPSFLTQSPTCKNTQTFSPCTSGFFSLCTAQVTRMRPRCPLPPPPLLPPPPTSPPLPPLQAQSRVGTGALQHVRSAFVAVKVETFEAV